MSTNLRLPHNYYHCLLGNGLDAVLIGPTGSLVPEKAGKERCYWYKSDRYYPEDKLVQIVDSRLPPGTPFEHVTGSGWYEMAPLGRTWYEIIWQGQPLIVRASEQRFVPQEGTLYSSVDYGPVHAQVTTFLHANQSLLIERYVFDREVEFRGWMGPGVWVEEGWDTAPFYSVSMAQDGAMGSYDLGETQGVMGLWLEPLPTASGRQGDDRWLSVRGTKITKAFAIRDNRQGPLENPPLFDPIAAAGFETLQREHLNFWRNYFAASNISIPDEQFQHFYEASLYHFKATQNRVSGGLPVNNLRLTWSSHIFWDSYFIQRALLEANHRAEALEACRFFQRTLEHARRHAQEEFGREGLKWDWEITHDGRKAYGMYLHLKDQAHNNGSYANEIWQTYEFTRDREMLREFYPILEGLARFFLEGIVEHSSRGYEIRSLVGVTEKPELVKNEGINLTATIAILRHAAEAARILGIESEFTRRCAEIAQGLVPALDRLYNGRFFASAEGSEALNLSSLAPLYPMQVLDFNDPRGVQTTQAFLEYFKRHLAAQGNNPSESGRTASPPISLPWVAGWLAAVLARQGRGDDAWEVIQSARPAICNHGGMTEVIQDNQWNMQYFSTAQGAVCTAIHHLLLQAYGDEIRIFPALPKEWMDKELRFDHLLAAGLSVSATTVPAARVGPTGRVKGVVRNITSEPLTRQIRCGQQSFEVALQPGEAQSFEI